MPDRLASDCLPSDGFAGSALALPPRPGALAAAASGFVPPPLIAAAGPEASLRFLEFFTATIRNGNTRAAYGRAVGQFLAWCEARGVAELAAIGPVHVAAYLECALQAGLSKPTVKQHLAAIRQCCDWLVVGQILRVNPAASVRGPKYVAKKGKTPALSASEARELLDSIDVSSLIGLRDRALIGVMCYSFARVGAAVAMRVEDYYLQGRRSWLRLHEKGGKRHDMPAHHNLEAYLDAYLDAARIRGESKTPLFRAAAGRTGQLTGNPLHRSDAWAMVQRRAAKAGFGAIGCHTFRATGITAYLKAGGALETAQAMAAHESPRTTMLYDRRRDEVTLDEVERIGI